MEAYILQNTYDGDKPRIFKSLHTAEFEASKIRERLHKEYCLEQKTPDGSCLCTMTQGGQMCAAHHYAENVDDHNLSDCDIGSDSNVFIEEAEME